MLDLTSHSSTFSHSTRICPQTFPPKPVQYTQSVNSIFCHWSSPVLSFYRGKPKLQRGKEVYPKFRSRRQSWDLNSDLMPMSILFLLHMVYLTTPLLASYCSMQYRFLILAFRRLCVNEDVCAYTLWHILLFETVSPAHPHMFTHRNTHIYVNLQVYVHTFSCFHSHPIW